MNFSSLLQATPELLAEYLNFLIGFVQKPRATLQPYAGKGSIDPKLMLFVVLSVGLSYVITLIASGIRVAEDQSIAESIVEDQSTILAFIGSFNLQLLPIIAVVLILAVAILLHLSARVFYSWVLHTSGESRFYLGGSVQDSINASFGFSAFFIPLMTLMTSALFLGIGILANQNPAVTTIAAVLIICFGGLVAALLIYYPAALSATHPNTSFGQAFLAMSAFWGAIGLIRVLLDFLERLFHLLERLFQ